MSASNERADSQSKKSSTSCSPSAACQPIVAAASVAAERVGRDLVVAVGDPPVRVVETQLAEGHQGKPSLAPGSSRTGRSPRRCPGSGSGSSCRRWARPCRSATRRVGRHVEVTDAQADRDGAESVEQLVVELELRQQVLRVAEVVGYGWNVPSNSPSTLGRNGPKRSSAAKCCGDLKCSRPGRASASSPICGASGSSRGCARAVTGAAAATTAASAQRARGVSQRRLRRRRATIAAAAAAAPASANPTRALDRSGASAQKPPAALPGCVGIAVAVDVVEALGSDRLFVDDVHLGRWRWRCRAYRRPRPRRRRRCRSAGS